MANNRVKGITIQIGGDTSDLQKSLSGVDKSLQNTQSQLRDINKLLKLDPKNTELLEQKQRKLGDAIKQTEDKLNALRDASKDAEEALKNGAMTQDQYDGLQREIMETETSLKNLKKEAEETKDAMSKWKGAEDALDKVGKKTEEVGKSLTKNVTAPILAVGGASMAAFNEVDNGLDNIAKMTGKTGDELHALEEVGKEVFSEMPVEIDDVGVAIGEINTRFGVTGDELKNLTEDFLKFSNITGADVQSSIANVDKIMTKFGVDSSQTKNVLGLFTSAAQRSGISVDTLQSSLESNGAQLKEMGFDLTESVNLLAQMEASGVDTGTAMSAFTKAVANATKEGKDAETAMREQIDAIKNAKTETEALQIATDLFGKKGAPEMTQAIREGRLSVDDLSGSLGDYANKVDQTFSDTQDATDEAKIAFNNLKLAGAVLGGAIGSVLTPVIKKLSDAFKGISDWFKKLSPQQQEMIVKIGLIVATIGPLLLIIAKVIMAVKTIMTILPAVKGAILAVNAALAANPLILIIGLIGGLVAAFILLWNNCEEFRQFWIDLWDNIKSVCSDAWEAITGFFRDAWDAIQGFFSGIGSWFSDRWSDVKNAFSEVTSFFEGAFSGAWSAIETAFSTVTSFFEDCWSAIKAPFENAASWFEGIFDAVKEAIKAPINWIIDAINVVIDGLNKLSVDIPGWVPGVGGQTWGIDISRVPRLASGAVIPPNSPFLAMLGDQRSGTNVEAPLETIKEALVSAMRENGGGGVGQIVVPVYIGQDRLDTVIAKANTNLSFISGGR